MDKQMTHPFALPHVFPPLSFLAFPLLLAFALLCVLGPLELCGPVCFALFLCFSSTLPVICASSTPRSQALLNSI